MVKPVPDAFLSYTRFDDRHGTISAFREWLSDAVREVTGEPFEIFQDVEGIGIGEHWPGKLDQMLDEVPFFIPILTPSYFRSQACRDELEKFLEAEKDRGRNDLVLPIYYIECHVLEELDARAADPLAATLHERQRQDWRELRHDPFEAKNVRRALERLARGIAQARWRAMRHADDEARKRVVEEARPKAADGRKGAEQARRRVEQAAAQPPAGRGNSVAVGTQRGRPAPSGQELKAGTIFRDTDAPWCPEIVVIPPGRFMMGYEQGPQHEVQIAYRFAVGRYAVTFEEYDHFCEAAGEKKPDEKNWGRGRRPAVRVSWKDAKAYVEWLSKETGRPYRLLSEAEWEYACRAGTTTRFWWGDDITPENANYGGGGNLGKTAEVGSYPPNPWGLYDMHGNVWEWVEDCWNDGYQEAPVDGSAWTSGDCGRRVLRGGSWDYRSVGPPLRRSLRGRRGRPGQRQGLPGCQDALAQRERYPLNLRHFTPWGLGRSPGRFFARSRNWV